MRLRIGNRAYDLELTKLATALFIIVGIFNTSAYGASLSWVMVPAVLIVVGVLLESNRLQLRPAHYMAMIFWIVTIMSTVMSSTVVMQRDSITSLIFTCLFILVTGSPRLKTKGAFFLKLYMGICAVVSVLIVLNWTRGIYYSAWYRRSTLIVGGVSKDPNYVSSFLAPAPILVFLFMKYRQGVRRLRHTLLQWGLVGLILFAMSLDGSRGGLISVGVGLFLFLLFSTGSTKKRMGAIFISGVLVAGLVFILPRIFPQQTIDRLLMEGSIEGRSVLWRYGIVPFLNSPIIGQGLGAASRYIGRPSHSMYVDILSSSGLVGGGLFLGMLLDIGFSGVRYKKDILFLCISLFLPLMSINGYNTTSQWIPIFMLYFAVCFLMQSEQTALSQEASQL